MLLLQSLDTSKICSIDIETVRLTENYKDLSPEAKEAWDMKFRFETTDPLELIELYQNKASLYAEFSKICAVSIAYVHKDKLIVREFSGESELQILDDVALMLRNIYAKGEYRLIGHNAKFFDYPFLCKRFMINGIPIPSILDTAHLKPWEQMNLDTNEIWKFGGTGPGASLPALCYALELETSKQDLAGDEVGKAYFNGEYDKIGRYCSYDAIATMNILRKLSGKSTFSFESAEIIRGSVEEDKVDALLEMAVNHKFTKDIQDSIRDVLGRTKIPRDDRNFITMILEAALLKSGMFNGDTKVQQAIKKDAIKEFLETLVWI